MATASVWLKRTPTLRLRTSRAAGTSWMGTQTIGEGHADLVRDVVAMAEERAAEWFPTFRREPVTSTLVSFAIRPRCFLYRLALTQGGERREIIAKVRHSDVRHRRADRYEDRPELTPQRTMSDEEAAHLEYVGLNLIAEALDGSDPDRFGVLRPLGELPTHATVVMEYLDQPTLRSLVARQWTPVGREMRARAGTGVWDAMGEWLKRFHGTHPGRSLPGRMTHTDDLVAQLDLSTGFLIRAGADPPSIRSLTVAAFDRLGDGRPAELPCAIGHGDFTSQNVFVAPNGRITVFDPLPLWRVCVFEDLARLTMGLRLLGPQAVTGGRLFRPGQLDRWESHLLDAYSGRAGPEADLLPVYQAVLLLDRWGELVSKHPARGRARRGVRRVRVRVVRRWFEQEARRLTQLLR
jgi:aminoglycoside phosphotransferase (APT) family kinase protein